MCGAFSFFSEDFSLLEWADRNGVLRISDSAQTFSPSYNIRPKQQMLAIWNNDGLEVNAFQFGITPHFNPKALWFNTRSEKFMDGQGYWPRLRNKRCIILANGFFEWVGEKAPKQPVYIQVKEKEVFGFAGLFNAFEKDGEQIRHGSIFTTSPNSFMEPIHDRMPVILPNDKWADYLSEEELEVDDFGEFLLQFDASKMKSHPVSKAVGSVANNSPELIEAI